jgi:hypothetical protein
MLATLILTLTACATAGGPPPPGEAVDELGTRLVERARGELGQRGPFTIGSERFPSDCSGFVSAVYQAEGVPLRQLGARAAPTESSGVAALYRAAMVWGVVFGGGGEWPRPGDLVFFKGTYDRERDGRYEAPFTHVGIVESVDENGTVTFIHRDRRAVVRNVLTPDRPGETRDEGGRELNSPMRNRRRHPTASGSSLAGDLFMGYGRIDPRRLPSTLSALR